MIINRVSNYGRNDLAVKFKDLGFKIGAEIGTERGKYAGVLLKANPNLKLYCVDPYEFYDNNEGYKTQGTQSVHDFNYKDAVKRLNGLNYEIIKTTSEKASLRFEDNSLDFVYIDGNHRLDYVVKDLILWTRKVKIGGIVAGHDYIKLKTQSQCHIPYALDAYFESYRMTQPLFLLDNKTKTNNSIDRIKSWYFIKEGND